MAKIKTFINFLLIAVCLAGMIPAAYAAEEVCTMWNMDTISSQNILENIDFVDTFGYEYESAVGFDVCLGSGAVYDLAGQYTRFTGTLTTSQQTNSDVVFDFAILLDGKIAYSKTGITKQTPPEFIDLDLSGVRTMQIVTSTKQRSYTFLYVADGQFYRSDAPVLPSQQFHSLNDVILVDSDRYEAKLLVQDSFGNLRANSHILGGWGDAYAVYNLDRKYDTFSAVVSFHVESSTSSHRTCEIYCDGKLVANYEEIIKQTQPISIEIDVCNVSVLKIVSRELAHVGWASTGSIIVGDTYLTPHVHVPGDIKDDIAPTCAKTGKKSYTCKVCGEVCGEEVIPALAHTAGEWKTEKETSCVSAGERVLRCLVCEGIMETEAIEQLAHTPSDAWVLLSEASCTESGMEGLFCLECNGALDKRIIDRTEHQMGKWETHYGSIWDAPICRVRECALCGSEETDMIFGFAWVKPMVLSIFIVMVMALVWCIVIMRRQCKKHGSLRVLIKACKLKYQDLSDTAMLLQNAISDLQS